MSIERAPIAIAAPTGMAWCPDAFAVELLKDLQTTFNLECTI